MDELVSLPVSISTCWAIANRIWICTTVQRTIQVCHSVLVVSHANHSLDLFRCCDSRKMALLLSTICTTELIQLGLAEYVGWQGLSLLI